MKKHFLQLLFLFFSLHFHAQENTLEKTLTGNKWKIDMEAMKPKMMISMGLVPEMKDLTLAEREQAIQSVLTALEMMTYHFKGDGSCIVSTGATKLKSTYTVKEDGKVVELKFESNEVDRYSVLSFTKDKIHLYSDERKNDLILIPLK